VELVEKLAFTALCTLAGTMLLTAGYYIGAFLATLA